jgi:hypothetical protein
MVSYHVQVNGVKRFFCVNLRIMIYLFLFRFSLNVLLSSGYHVLFLYSCLLIFLKRMVILLTFKR